MSLNSIKRWVINAVKNNLWIIVLAFIMWIISSANGLKFSEAAVQNASQNVKNTLGSYLFLSSQLETLPAGSLSTTEEKFVQESTRLKHKNDWSIEDINGYLASIQSVEEGLDAKSETTITSLKRVLFVQRHAPLSVALQSQNAAVRLHTTLLTRFPQRLVYKKLGISSFQPYTIPPLFQSVDVLIPATLQ